jgi:hypothetical protein
MSYFFSAQNVKSGAVHETLTEAFKNSNSLTANPNHEPNPGWVNDDVTITISQV